MTVEIFESTPVGGVWTAPLGVTSVQYLVVGGGGSGGNQYGGGGGAGGAVGGELSVTPGSSYTLLVGAGGNDSQFDTKIGYAGGAGGSGPSDKGANGGCGGGGGVAGRGAGSQGYDGGSNNAFYGGGGGGMGGAGGAANAFYGGGGGGRGISSSISGSVVWYAGGGGGGSNAGYAAGGAGGGGGGADAGEDGGANTGGGGGGGYLDGGGHGGSGVIVLNYTINTPAAPTNVEATQNNSSKVTITWQKNHNASAYRVLRDGSVIATLGDVATYDDSTAAAPAITPGTASASDGTIQDYVALNLSGASIANGTAYSYTVQGYNSAGWGTVSSAATGYRKANSLTYQWLRSAADSDASYSEIPGATTASYNDIGISSDGSGRYYQCVLSANGSVSHNSTPDRGYRASGGLFVFNG